MFTIYGLTIHTYQIIIPIVVIIGIYLLNKHYKNHEVNLGFYVFGIVLGILLTLIAFTPNFTGIISNLIGIRRGLDFVIMAAIGLIIFGIYLISNKVDETSDRINDLTKILENKENDF